MKTPIAVLISDVHYNLSTLPLADAAMRQAINKANQLDIPLIVCGDLHDTKAAMRAECVNAMIETFKLCKIKPFVLVGNHDRINEKAPAHSLNFLTPYAEIIEDRGKYTDQLFLVPYEHDPESLRNFLRHMPKGAILIMHQGLQNSHMGDYIHDKSAINKSDVAGFRVISGHYHTRQSIDLPDNGTWDYVGNPFTLTQGEANDPEKGFQVLHSDGTLDFIPTNLRRHRVWECSPDLVPIGEYSPGDILTIKVRGTHEELSGITRSKVQEKTGIEFFKLDLIPTAAETKALEVLSLNQGELLDNLIDSLSNTSDDRKTNLKELWRRLS